MKTRYLLVWLTLFNLVRPPALSAAVPVDFYNATVSATKELELGVFDLNPNSEIAWGTCPPRALFSAPSRKTPVAGKGAESGNPPTTESAGREGASSHARGGRAPRTSEFKLKAGENEFSATVVGANAKAVKAYMLGLDYLLLKPVE